MNFALLIVNLTCTLIPLLARNKFKGLKWSLFILFIFLALRYDFGEDYIAYKNLFEDMTFQERYDNRVEIGYNLLCELFRPFGFFSMVAFMSGIYCVSLYKTILRYITPRWYWFIIFCLISNGDLVFVGCSAMRQTLAMSIILLSLPFLEKEKPIYFWGMVVLATCFHASAFVFFILYPLIKVNTNSRSFVILFGIFAILSITVLQSTLAGFISDTVSSNFEKYHERYGDSTEKLAGGVIGTAIRMVFLAIFLFKLLYEKNIIRTLFYILSIVCIIIFTMRGQVMLQRYTLYFGYMMSFCLTYVIDDLTVKKNIYYYISLALIVFWHLNLAFTFAYNNHIYEYHTIF